MANECREKGIAVFHPVMKDIEARILAGEQVDCMMAEIIKGDRKWFEHEADIYWIMGG